MPLTTARILLLSSVIDKVPIFSDAAQRATSEIAKARLTSPGGRGSVTRHRCVQSKLRDLFIIQCRSHNTHARLKSVMMFFGNVLCSFKKKLRKCNRLIKCSSPKNSRTFFLWILKDSRSACLCLHSDHKPLLATPNHLRELSSCLK